MNLLLLLLTFAIAFDPQDHEIFDLQESLRKLYGPKATFYSILGLEEQATDKQITKEYRKKSLQYHPDKNPSEEARDVYKLLTTVASTLKDKELRLRYDQHLKRGFPTWRGSGYYYSYFEPGLGFLVVFLLAMISTAQYIIQWVFYYRAITEVPEEEPIKNVSQIKKQLKQEGVKVSRKDLKTLAKEVEVEEIPKPRVLDLLIFQFPFYIYRFVTGFFVKGGDTVKEKSE